MARDTTNSEYAAVLKNHAVSWPGLCCWWCTLPFVRDKNPVPMAVDYAPRTGRFELRGFFCDLSCVKAFAISRGVSFSYSLMHAQRTDRRCRRRRPVVAAANYLSHRRFGPGIFRSSSGAVRRRTREVEPNVSISSSRRCGLRSTTQNPAAGTSDACEPQASVSLRRSRRRYGGAGTLVPWLSEAESR
jgi:hypothetical protein